MLSTFGELFADPNVEQYYEALVGTMKGMLYKMQLSYQIFFLYRGHSKCKKNAKAAKRNGLISFKGQFLLKGMHDAVVVHIVNSDDAIFRENRANFREFQPKYKSNFQTK